MFSRVAKVGVLAALVIGAIAGPVGAFGRKSSSTCSSSYSWCCPYYPPVQPVVYAGLDCVENRTNLILRVHIASGYGSWEAVLQPGQRASFWFIKDGKPRLLSAFTLDNKPIDLIFFTPIDQYGQPKMVCFPVIQSLPAAAPAKEAERQRVEGAAAGSPTGQPF